MASFGMRIRPFVVLTFFIAAPALAQHSAMPEGMTHEQHMEQMKKDAAMKERGAVAMGFDQDTTTHHFTMQDDGGAIEVAANDAADQAGIAHVQQHLQEIAAAFKQGDFGKPQATHGEVPPGVPVMQRLKDAITYTYAETPRGGRVRIATANVEARGAIHAFLSYQTREHKTRGR